MSKFGLYTSFFKTSRSKIRKRLKKAKNTGFGKIKTCLALNWVIRLRPKFTTFQFLISSVIPQKLEAQPHYFSENSIKTDQD